jgi:sec-independent protein translocase protein TatA
MFGIGMPELIVILLIVLVLFGASRLPEIGTGLGKAIRGFKKGISEPTEINVTPDPKASSVNDKEKKENKS